MLGFGKDREKSPIELLNDAYRVGGVPWALVVLGALCLLLPFGERFAATNVVNPETSFIVGGVMVAVGAMAWAFATQQRTHLQTALFDLVAEIARQAAATSKDGANFRVAMEQFVGELPKLISVLASSESKVQEPSAKPPS